MAVVLIVAVIFIVARPGRQTDQPVAPTVAAVATAAVADNPLASAIEAEDEDATSQTQYSNISEMLADNENFVEGLSDSELVQVENLSINQSLPSEWMNILLLGTDERKLTNSSRTDAILICSLNRNTGEVKLSSIMRDLGVELKDIGKYSGTYGINAAAYFGGPNLAMKTINECFDMNIQYYVMVNFFGFQKIAQRLGGVEVDVSEQEMKMINYRIVEQYKFAVRAGVDESDLPNELLENYGPGTHLDGRQTLAYARLRKTDGGDYRRTERQQTVLKALMEKAKTLNALQITQLAAEMFSQVKTNMEMNDIINLAIKVAGNGISNLETFRLPINGTYKEERRNNKSLLWDCDFSTNAVKLYDFIYE